MNRPPRVVFSIEMSADAHAAVRRVIERRAMKQKVFVSRVLSWFGQLPIATQDRILGDDVELERTEAPPPE